MISAVLFGKTPKLDTFYRNSLMKILFFINALFCNLVPAWSPLFESRYICFVFNCSLLSTLSVTRTVKRRIVWKISGTMDWRLSGRVLICDMFPPLAWRDSEKSRRASFRIVSFPAEIRTRYFPNTSQRRHRCSQLALLNLEQWHWGINLFNGAQFSSRIQ
jgi:hypothetical protein